MTDCRRFGVATAGQSAIDDARGTVVPTMTTLANRWFAEPPRLALPGMRYPERRPWRR